MVEIVQPRRFGTGQQPVKPANSSRRLIAAFDFATASHWRAMVFLVLCGLVFFLPGFFNMPPIDRDEARFAQATKQMVETGDFVDIRFQDEVRYKKPVGIYWLQAAAVETASALGLAARGTAHLAVPRSIADRRDRRRPADLLGGACFRDATRGGVRRD